jgi:hypothetical protein
VLFDEIVHVMDDSDDELALESMVCAVAGIYGSHQKGIRTILTISFPL